MRGKLFIMFAVCLGFFSAGAQSPVIGERPELRVTYLDSKPSGGPMLVEFYVSRSPSSEERIRALSKMASDYSGQLNVVLVTREGNDVIESHFRGKNYPFHVALDDNDRTFKAFGVQYLPYAVMLDSRGRVVWFGNPTTLDDNTIKQALNL